MTAPHTALINNLVRLALNAVDERVADVQKNGGHVTDDTAELHARVSVWVITMFQGRTNGEAWNEDVWKEDAEMVLDGFDPTNFTHEVWPVPQYPTSE